MHLPHLRSTLIALFAGGVCAACSRSSGTPSCGIAALTGPLAIKESFAEGSALANPPEFVPPHLAVRLVAGPVWPAGVTLDSAKGWRVTVHGTVSRQAHVGYGVLIIDDHDVAQGVLAYDGLSIRGAERLGTLDIGDTVVPLLGVRFDLGKVRDAQCPLFPDSLK